MALAMSVSQQSALCSSYDQSIRKHRPLAQSVPRSALHLAVRQDSIMTDFVVRLWLRLAMHWILHLR